MFFLVSVISLTGHATSKRYNWVLRLQEKKTMFRSTTSSTAVSCEDRVASVSVFSFPPSTSLISSRDSWPGGIAELMDDAKM